MRKKKLILKLTVITILVFTYLFTSSSNSSSGKDESRIFNAPASIIAILLIWFIHMIMIILNNYIFHKEDKKAMNQILDGCNTSTAYHKYLLKLKIGSSFSNYNQDTSAIMIDLLDKNRRFITRLSIPPAWIIKKSFPFHTEAYPDMKIMKFTVFRANIMPDVGFCRITHDCFRPPGAQLMVYGVEIRDLTGNGLRSADIPIFQKIKALGPDAEPDHNCFPAEHVNASMIKLEEDLIGEDITANLQFPEMIMFLFFFTNMDIVASTTLGGYTDNSFGDWDTNFKVGLFACVICCTLTGISIFIYKWFIKKKYALNRGAGAWSAIRLIFLIILIAAGFVMGGLGAAMGFIIKTDETNVLATYAQTLFFSAVDLLIIIMSIIGWMYLKGELFKKSEPRPNHLVQVSTSTAKKDSSTSNISNDTKKLPSKNPIAPDPNINLALASGEQNVPKSVIGKEESLVQNSDPGSNYYAALADNYYAKSISEYAAVLEASKKDPSHQATVNEITSKLKTPAPLTSPK